MEVALLPGVVLLVVDRHIGHWDPVLHLLEVVLDQDHLLVVAADWDLAHLLVEVPDLDHPPEELVVAVVPLLEVEQFYLTEIHRVYLRQVYPQQRVLIH